jgi:hypothetical protein
MQTILFVIFLAFVAPQLQAGGYPQDLYDAIEAVHNARETLVSDLEK